ncbi:MAG: bile acid:sodium symporter family protein [Candidatus Adiutrix sp.]
MKKLTNKIDGFSLAMFIIVGAAIVLPVSGQGYQLAAVASKLVVAFLFFLHGLKLSPQNLWAGLTHWKLHLSILGATFVFFPLLGLSLKPLVEPWLGSHLYIGFLFVCLLPSTVQSSIAFTSMAGGNVAAAVCAASASSLLGIVITPVLVTILLQSTLDSGVSGQAVINLAQQLLLPFLLGQALRFKLAPLLVRHASLVGYVDRISVLFIVYVSFSHATTSGLWQSLTWPIFLAIVASCAILLALTFFGTWKGGAFLGFTKADRITLLFCGSKKSLVAGVPMANIIFGPALAGVIILPLMIFHQMQLILCAFITPPLSRDLTDKRK